MNITFLSPWLVHIVFVWKNRLKNRLTIAHRSSVSGTTWGPHFFSGGKRDHRSNRIGLSWDVQPWKPWKSMCCSETFSRMFHGGSMESPSYWLLKWANVPILPWSHQGLGSFQRFLRKPVLRIQWCQTSHLYSLGINEHPLNIRHIDLQNILSLCCFVVNCPCQKSKSSREFWSWILLVADLRKANCQDCPAAQCCSRPAAGG